MIINYLLFINAFYVTKIMNLLLLYVRKDINP